MLKLAGCVLLVISSTLTGFYFSNYLKLRKDFLKDFIAFLNTLKIQLRYSSGDIFQIIPLCSDSKILKPLFDQLSKSRCDNISFSELWINSVCVGAKVYKLKQSEINALADFGSKLGTTDTEGELSNIDLYTEVFLKSLENAMEDLSKKSKLYKTMGFFIGMSTALMIV